MNGSSEEYSLLRREIVFQALRRGDRWMRQTWRLRESEENRMGSRGIGGQRSSKSTWENSKTEV